MDKLTALFSKRVLGVPVAYIALVLAAGLAFLGWKASKSAPTDEEADPVEEAGAAEEESSGAPTLAGGNYDAVTGKGTVTTVVQEADKETPVTVETNETWAKKAVEWLVATNKAGGGDAQNAIGKYLGGDALTYQQGVLRDAAIKEFGLPPDSVTQVGTTSAPPAQKQFAGSSGRHTVKGGNDNTAAKLASLYYGSAASAKVIAKANNTLGAGPYSKGAVLFIPDASPARYFTATSKVRAKAAIAAANGIPVSRLEKFNPGLPNIVVVGRKVRVA